MRISIRPAYLLCALGLCITPFLAACGSDAALTATTDANTTTQNANATTQAAGSTTSNADETTISANTSLSENSNYVLTPSLEVGPYYVDEELNRSNVVTDTKTGAAQEGASFLFNIYVHEVSNGNITPYAGVVVDMWEANAAGEYSDESAESTSGANWLRGLQIADANGLVSFATLIPGWYSGLAPHIHLALRKAVGSGVTLKFSTRAFFDDDFMAHVYASTPYSMHTGQNTFTTNDRLFNSTCTSGTISFKCGEANLLTPTTVDSAYTATLHLYVDPLGDTAASQM